jgi:succinyl-CoA synthetase beta subunit
LRTASGTSRTELCHHFLMNCRHQRWAGDVGRVLEDDSKRVLSGFGLTVPRGGRVTIPDDAQTLASTMPGGCVVKALVPAGRRGKAGFVQVCESPGVAGEAATRMLGEYFGSYRVTELLVEERIDIASEYYLSIMIDPATVEIALLLSAHGGVEVEEHSGEVVRIGVNPLGTVDLLDLVKAWDKAGAGRDADALAEATVQALTAFRDLDATLLEINPLAVSAAGQVVVVDTMLAIDDLALQRQRHVAPLVIEGSDRAARPETALELRVAEINADRSERGSARYLELEGGDIGFLCGGGGASLLLFDALVTAGGAPANYSEFGGNPTEKRVYDLTRVVLDKPGVRGLFVAHNITNNTQVDVVARGVTRAVADAKLPPSFPVVAREVGVNDEEGRRLFEDAGVHYLGAEITLDRAAQIMVDVMRQTGAT